MLSFCVYFKFRFHLLVHPHVPMENTFFFFYLFLMCVPGAWLARECVRACVAWVRRVGGRRQTCSALLRHSCLNPHTVRSTRGVSLHCYHRYLSHPRNCPHIVSCVVPPTRGKQHPSDCVPTQRLVLSHPPESNSTHVSVPTLHVVL